MDLDSIMTATQAVAVHAGTGMLLGAGIYTLAAIGIRGAEIHSSDTGEVTAIGFAAAGIAAGIMGPEMFGSDISAYLHQPSLGGIALGSVGAATVGAVGGFLAGISYDDDHGRILSGLNLGMYTAIGATALYWGMHAANYFRG